MNRTFVTGIIMAGLIGFVAGNAFLYLFMPLWNDHVVSESFADEANAATIAVGKIQDADEFHKGSGSAKILRTTDGKQILRFTDFHTTNGPDLKVYLVKAVIVENAEDVTDNEWVSLGALKGNIGNQNYTLPTDVDPSNFGAVAIWCEQFGVLFSSASLVWR